MTLPLTATVTAGTASKAFQASVPVAARPAGYDGTGSVLPGVTRTKLTITGPITQSGVLFKDLDINGVCLLQTDKATFQNCTLRLAPGGYLYGTTGDGALIDSRGKQVTSLVVEHCLLDNSANPNVAIDGVIGHHRAVTNTEITGVTDGVGSYNTFAADVANLLDNVWIHDMIRLYDPDHKGPSHNDGLQHQGGSGLIVRNSTIDGSLNVALSMAGTTVSDSSSAINLQQDTAYRVVAPVIDNNVIDYGGTASLLIHQADHGQITRNAFGRHQADPRYVLRVIPGTGTPGVGGTGSGGGGQTFTDDLTTNYWADTKTPLAAKSGIWYG